MSFYPQRAVARLADLGGGHGAFPIDLAGRYPNACILTAGADPMFIPTNVTPTAGRLIIATGIPFERFFSQDLCKDVRSSFDRVYIVRRRLQAPADLIMAAVEMVSHEGEIHMLIEEAREAAEAIGLLKASGCAAGLIELPFKILSEEAAVRFEPNPPSSVQWVVARKIKYPKRWDRLPLSTRRELLHDAGESERMGEIASSEEREAAYLAGKVRTRANLLTLNALIQAHRVLEDDSTEEPPLARMNMSWVVDILTMIADETRQGTSLPGHFWNFLGDRVESSLQGLLSSVEDDLNLQGKQIAGENRRLLHDLETIQIDRFYRQAMPFVRERSGAPAVSGFPAEFRGLSEGSAAHLASHAERFDYDWNLLSSVERGYKLGERVNNQVSLPLVFINATEPDEWTAEDLEELRGPLVFVEDVFAVVAEAYRLDPDSLLVREFWRRLSGTVKKRIVDIVSLSATFHKKDRNEDPGR